jgi:outer membrane protein insertion porin family
VSVRSTFALVFAASLCASPALAQDQAPPQEPDQEQEQEEEPPQQEHRHPIDLPMPVADELEPDVGSDPTTADETGDAGEVEAPPIVWQDWRVDGQLVETAETIEAFLEFTMSSRQALTKAARAEVDEFCQEIGYHLIDIPTEPMEGGGTRAVLMLEPVTLVRSIDVAVGNSVSDLEDYIFKDEVTRRMRLRPGTALARSAIDRQIQLDAEALRLRDYLRDEGFFEARVAVTWQRRGDWAAKLNVKIDKRSRYRVGKVTVTGNDSVASSEIVGKFRHCRLELLTLCFGVRRFSRSQLNDDVKAVINLYQRRGFPGVRVRTDFNPGRSFKRDSKTVELIVTITERRKVHVIFEGNDSEKFPDDKLDNLMTFDDEGAYDDVEVDASAAAVRRYYQGRGHFEAHVTAERLSFKQLERVVVSIDEGPVLKVRRIDFEGNKAFSDGELRGVVGTSVYSGGVLASAGGFASGSQLRDDVDALADRYRDEGFPDVTVRARVTRDERVQGNAAALAATIAAETKSSDLFVQFFIEERKRTSITSLRIEFDGTHERAADEILDVMSVRKGDAFIRDKLDDEVDKVKRYYFQRGYPHASVEVEVEGAHEKTVVFKVREHHQVTFGKVMLRGNFKTADWVILDELGYTPGETLTLSEAERGQQNVRNTGLFNAVQVSMVNFDEETEDSINVVVSVEERHDRTGSVLAGGGISSDRGWFTEGQLDLPNLWGIGVRNELRLVIGEEIKNLEERLTLPRWIARRAVGVALRTEVAAFIRQDTTERFGELTSFGTSLAFTKVGTRGFFRGWLFTVRYDLRQRNRDEDLVRPAGANDDLTQSKVTTRTGAVGPQIIIDKRVDSSGRPSPLTPEGGWRVEGHALFADTLLLGQDRFLKFGGSGQLFWRVTDRLLLTNALRYDHGVPFGGDVLLPEVERFFAGGDTTVRGFEEDRLATEIIEEPLAPLGEVTSLRVLPAGGNVRAIWNVDLQMRVWELGSIPVASAIFVDTGIVTNSLDGVQIEDLRHAVGIALFRLVSPFGSLSVEWAIPLDPKPGDNPRGRFHFNFGLLF